MNNSTKALEKSRRRVNQIRRQNPNISYRDAQTQARIEREEKVSGRRKVKAAKKQARTVGAKYRVRHVVEKIGASQVNQTRKQLENELKAQRAWMLLEKDSATSKEARDRAARELAANKRELKAISGRKPKPSRKKRRK